MNAGLLKERVLFSCTNDTFDTTCDTWYIYCIYATDVTLWCKCDYLIFGRNVTWFMILILTSKTN